MPLGSSRAGVIVVAPLLGTAALMANEVYLVSRIARVYGIKLSERAVIAFIGAAYGVGWRKFLDNASIVLFKFPLRSGSHTVWDV